MLLASFLLESDHGCGFNLAVDVTSQHGNSRGLVADDRISWADDYCIRQDNKYSENAIVRLNKECPGDEVILMNTP